MLYGAIMQWLNPKAWLACVAGMGLFVADGDAASSVAVLRRSTW